MSFCKVFLLLFTFLIITGMWYSSLAQNNDTLINLPEIEILKTRNSIFNTGRQEERIDSVLLINSGSGNLSSILSAGSNIFVKTYGGGGSASLSIRGTEARHTSVLWNGFNINSPSLGVSDVANIPGCITDEIKLVKGGTSAVNGNASIGGTLILTNLPTTFKKNFYTTLSAELGSFSNQNLYTKTYFSNYFISSSTKLFINQAENDFKFINNTKKNNPEEILSNAKSKNYGIIQDFSFKLNTDQFLEASLWYQVTNREIPPIMNVPVSAANQRDSTLRVFAGYRKFFKKSIVRIKGGYFNEFQFYDDTIQKLDLKYKVNSYHAEGEYSIHINEKTRFNTGINYIKSIADIAEYQQTRTRYQLSIFSNLIFIPVSEWTLNFNLRLEQVTYKNPPLSPSFGIKGNLYKNWIFFTGSAGRNYSLPSLNDMYWVPGGNVKLKPEDAWSYEAGISIFEKKPKLPVLKAVYFGSKVKNWIKWQPGSGGIYKPENISQVSTSGIEVSLNHNIKHNAIEVFFSTSVAYTKSIFDKSDELYSENIIGKQLTYIPLYTSNTILNIKYINSSMQLSHSFTGERFTTSDNSKSLPGFYIINIYFEQEFNFKQHSLSAFFKVNNLTDSIYEVIALRPTPGRWFTGGIKIKINYINKYIYEN